MHGAFRETTNFYWLFPARNHQLAAQLRDTQPKVFGFKGDGTNALGYVRLEPSLACVKIDLGSCRGTDCTF